MKYYILKEMVNYLQKFKAIKLIKRVQNNTILIEFNDKNIIYFDMTRGNSYVYKKQSVTFGKKDFNAPFDVLLQKRFNSSKIKKVSLYNNDKILNIEVDSKSAYKSQTSILQLEFTGKHTNIIILDENRIVLDALRHIDEDMSSRIVKVGQKLDDIPKAAFVPKIEEIDDFEKFLFFAYEAKEQKELQSIKKQRIAQLDKNKSKIEKRLGSLESKEELEKESSKTYAKANLILSNLHKIKPYQKSVKLVDFDGKNITIELNMSDGSPSNYANRLFTNAKKLKQKANNQYKEKQNLEEKLDFFNRMIKTIKEANTSEDIEFYFPKKEKNQAKTKKSENYASFFFHGYKIMLGRDERENIYLLENSRASDFWFHLKDRHSCHVIVKNSKKTIPDEVIEKAAKLCAKFSVDSGGSYLVDYTQRRNVKIQNKANVLYNPYNTIGIRI